MKRLVARTGIFLSCLLLAGILAGTTVSVQSVAAAVVNPGGPGGGSVASGGGCSLPDGSSGVYMSDGKTCCPAGSSNTNPSTCLFAKYVNPLVTMLSVVVGVVVVIGILRGTIEYITSSGDPQKAANGKKHVTSALIGLVAFILLVAFMNFMLPGGL